MGNFTKSIFYSGTVLAAGLIAIFSIYSNMTGQTGFSAIEPAAGEVAAENSSAEAANISAVLSGTLAETIQEAAAEVSSAQELSIEAVIETDMTEEEVSAIKDLKATAEDASSGTDMASEADITGALQAITPAAGTEDSVAPAVSEAAAEAVESAIGASH